MRRVIIAAAFASLAGIIIGVAAFQYQEYLQMVARYNAQDAACGREEGEGQVYCREALWAGESTISSKNTDASNLAMLGIAPIGAAIALFFAARK